MKQAADTCKLSGLWFKRGTPSLGSLTVLQRAVSMLFAPKEDIIFVILDKTFSLLRRESLSLYFKAICYLDVFEKIGAKAVSASVCKM